MSHKEEHPLDVRKASSASIRAKHPDRIPVIVEKRQRDASLPEIDKKKFLVPSDLTVGQFVYVIRKRIKLAPEQAIFLFVSAGTLPPTVAPDADLPLDLLSRCHRPTDVQSNADGMSSTSGAARTLASRAHGLRCIRRPCRRDAAASSRCDL